MVNSRHTNFCVYVCVFECVFVWGVFVCVCLCAVCLCVCVCVGLCVFNYCYYFLRSEIPVDVFFLMFRQKHTIFRAVNIWRSQPVVTSEEPG